MIRGRWEEVLEAAKRSRRATWALVGPNSQPGGINGDVFEVIFSGQGLVNAFENGGHGPVLSRALHQALGLELEVHAVLAGPGGGGPSGPSDPGGGGRSGGPAGPSGYSAGPGDPAGGGPSGYSAGPGGPAGPSGPAGAGGYPAGPSGSAVPGAEASAQSTRAASRTRAPAGTASPEAVENDGWGVIAVPGGRSSADESLGRAGRAEGPEPSEAGPSDDAGTSCSPDSLDQPTSEPLSPQSGHPVIDSVRPASSPSAEQDSGGYSEFSESPGLPDPTDARRVDQASPPVETPRPVGPAPSAASPAGPVPGTTASPGAAASAASATSVASPPSPSGAIASPAPELVDTVSDTVPEPADGAPLATVHRLHALPTLPGGAAPSSPPPPSVPTPPPSSSTPQSEEHGEPREHEGLAPIDWDSPATFSDGRPIPQEPPPEDEGEDGPEDSGTGWAPAGAAHDRVSAARAAARAAARGESLPGPGSRAASSTAFASSVENDAPSEDDEDAEEAGVVGLDVVKRLLGARVLEEITVTQEGR